MIYCAYVQFSAEHHLEDEAATAAAEMSGGGDDGDCHVFQTDHELFFHLVK
jgi:hypothetical protein